MYVRRWLFVLVLVASVSAVAPVSGASGRYREIDVPGAALTEAYAINDGGTIAGIAFFPSASATVGFVRTPRGRVKTFTVPGADGGVQFMYINRHGVIAGDWADAGSHSHGFVRATDGTITTFDCPGSTPSNSLFVFGLNASGVVAGNCGIGGLQEAFIGNPLNGPVTTFQIGTFATFGGGVNDSGEMTGYYYNGSTYSGFIRDAAANVTNPLDAPLATATKPTVINASGTIGGLATVSGASRGFTRDAGGTSATFSCGFGAPGGSGLVAISALGASGMMTGACVDNGLAFDVHGFEWKGGVIRTIEPPGASASGAESINRAGKVVGYAVFPAGDYHGFLYTP